jgi:hypothetical protein
VIELDQSYLYLEDAKDKRGGSLGDELIQEEVVPAAGRVLAVAGGVARGRGGSGAAWRVCLEPLEVVE